MKKVRHPHPRRLKSREQERTQTAQMLWTFSVAVAVAIAAVVQLGAPHHALLERDPASVDAQIMGKIEDPRFEDPSAPPAAAKRRIPASKR